jgi:hypothetical protein
VSVADVPGRGDAPGHEADDDGEGLEGRPAAGAGTADDVHLWLADSSEEPHSLVDLVNRVLDRGVVITGHVTLSVAGVDLVYLGLNAVLTSIADARRAPESLDADQAVRPVGTGGE